MPKKIRATRKGRDLDNRTKTRDASVRLEGSGIYVDLFNSKIKNPNAAHITTESFGNSKKGKKEANRFLAGEGFDYSLF